MRKTLILFCNFLLTITASSQITINDIITTADRITTPYDADPEPLHDLMDSLRARGFLDSSHTMSPNATGEPGRTNGFIFVDLNGDGINERIAISTVSLPNSSRRFRIVVQVTTNNLGQYNKWLSDLKVLPGFRRKSVAPFQETYEPVTPGGGLPNRAFIVSIPVISTGNPPTNGTIAIRTLNTYVITFTATGTYR